MSFNLETNCQCGHYPHFAWCPEPMKESREKNKVEAIQDITNPTRYQDLNLCALERAALAMTEGHEKYEKDLSPEAKNYQKADLKFALGRIGNAIKHLLTYNELVLRSLRGEDVVPYNMEDHLGHCLANLNMLAKYEELGILPNTRVD